MVETLRCTSARNLCVLERHSTVRAVLQRASLRPSWACAVRSCVLSAVQWDRRSGGEAAHVWCAWYEQLAPAPPHTLAVSRPVLRTQRTLVRMVRGLAAGWAAAA